MKFQERERPGFPEINRWLVSENGAFAITVLNYLFGMKCIQVLHRRTPVADWYVVQEWRTCVPELVETLIQKIRGDLSELEATFGGWKLVEDLLPPKRAKYLEDEPVLSTKKLV